MRRREFVATVPVVGTTLTAGCAGSGSQETDGTVDEPTESGSKETDGTADEPTESGSKETDGADTNGDGQDDGSTNDGSSDDGSSDGEDELEDVYIIETEPVEFENYTRETFGVEILDFCNDGTTAENWIGPHSGLLGFALSILGQEGCEQVSRTNETYDTETDTLTIELDFSAPEGATGCDSDCTVQHEVLAGYTVPGEWSEVSVEVYITRNGGEPELRTSWPVQN